MKAPININYAASVAQVSQIIPLENCDNVVHGNVLSNLVVVSKDTKPGDIGLFFPLECKLSDEFLSNNNLFRDPTLNVDKSKKGYFETNGRIRCVKFRGNVSQGFFIPLTSLDFITKDYPKLGTDFDELNGIKICEKYIPKSNYRSGNVRGNSDRKIVKRISRLVDNQYRLHVDTAQLKRNMHKINPEDLISITYKMHGTSGISSRVLAKRKLNWKDRIAKRLGVKVQTQEYDVFYGSRRVVKNEFETQNSNHFYSYDLWNEATQQLFTSIQSGITLYYEIVGFTKDGGFIQKGYDYRCEEKQFKIYIYRITSTNVDGKVIEFTWGQVKEYCHNYGLNYVPEIYYGKAVDLYPSLDVSAHWSENFLNKLIEDYDNGTFCHMCMNEVPAEGIVLKKDTLFDCEVFKLKQTAFLEAETALLDKGEVSIEELS